MPTLNCLSLTAAVELADFLTNAPKYTAGIVECEIAKPPRLGPPKEIN